MRGRLTLLGVALAGFLLVGATITRVTSIQTLSILGGVLSFGGDTFLIREAANTLAQRNGTAAQVSRLYNTFTDDSNFERGELVWTGSTFIIGTNQLGTGSARNMRFRTGGTDQWLISTLGTLAAVTDNTVDFGTSGANRPRDAFLARNLHVAGFFHLQSALTYGAHVVVIANNAVGASANAETLAGNRALYFIDCNDPDGCTITLGETSIAAGQVTTLTNSGGANNFTLADAAPHHLSAAFTGTPDDVITLIYVINRSSDGNWREMSRSAN